MNAKSSYPQTFSIGNISTVDKAQIVEGFNNCFQISDNTLVIRFPSQLNVSIHSCPNLWIIASLSVQ